MTLSQAEITDILIYYIVPVEKVAQYCLKYEINCKILCNEFSFSFFLILFIYFWLRWVFVAVRGLSLDEVSGGYSSLGCTGF